MNNTKEQIRKNMMSKRNNLSLEYIDTFAKAVSQRITSLKSFADATVIMAYIDFRNEAPTYSIIQKILQNGKKLVLPYTDNTFLIHPYILPAGENPFDFMQKSSFGVWEPDINKCSLIAPEEIDFVIVPGVAFDKSGSRIGYGKGCYDKFLPLLKPNTPKFALAYDFQILANIPSNSIDVKVDGFV